MPTSASHPSSLGKGVESHSTAEGLKSAVACLGTFTGSCVRHPSFHFHATKLVYGSLAVAVQVARVSKALKGFEMRKYSALLALASIALSPFSSQPSNCVPVRLVHPHFPQRRRSSTSSSSSMRIFPSIIISAPIQTPRIRRVSRPSERFPRHQL